MYNQPMSDSTSNYPQKTFTHAVAAVDVVMFKLTNGILKVLLLKLKEAPFLGKWALPGGLVTADETLEGSARRHLENKVGISGDVFIEQLYTFGDPDRDPHGWVVSVAYLGLTRDDSFEPTLSSRYDSVAWHSVSNLPELGYDHKKIIEAAVDRLQSKLLYTNIIFALMPKEFTLTQLQSSYENILGKKLDKRNFRKKILSTKILKDLKRKTHNTASRPAALYTFSSPKLEEIIIL